VRAGARRGGGGESKRFTDKERERERERERETETCTVWEVWGVGQYSAEARRGRAREDARRGGGGESKRPASASARG